jgi:hypothetical protein
MQEFLKNINLYDSGGIPPYFSEFRRNSALFFGIPAEIPGKKSPEFR